MKFVLATLSLLCVVAVADACNLRDRIRNRFAQRATVVQTQTPVVYSYPAQSTVYYTYQPTSVVSGCVNGNCRLK